MTSATRRPDAPGAIEGAAETAASVGRYKGLMARGNLRGGHCADVPDQPGEAVGAETLIVRPSDLSAINPWTRRGHSTLSGIARDGRSKPSERSSCWKMASKSLRSCRYGRDQGERNERSPLRRPGGLIGVPTTPPPMALKAIAPSTAARRTGECQADTYRLAVDCPGQVVSIANAGLEVILRLAQWW
jgi:hypothetical protein